jgi:hypothetical protein
MQRREYARMKVAAHLEDITPAEFFPLGGMHKVVVAKEVDMPLQVRILALSDGERTAIIVAIDVIGLTKETIGVLRDAIADTCPSVPSDAILFACSHTHSAPLTTFFAGNMANRPFLDFLRDKVAKAVRAAVDKLQPATLSYASAQAPGLTFNRRPIYATDHGEQVGTHGPTKVPHFIRMESPPDEEIQILVAHDGAGKCVGGLVNFACHPTLTGVSEVYSADFCGSLVAALDQQLGGVFGFIQGASADLCASHPDIRMEDLSGIEAARKMGKSLAETAIASLALAKPIPADAKLTTLSRDIEIAQRPVTEAALSRAQTLLSEGPGNATALELNRRQYGFDYTFYGDGPNEQLWFANESVGMWEWQQRSSIAPLTEALEVWVLSIGDFAVTSFPAEMFAELGADVKARSPFALTMISTLSNGWHGYVPTEAAFTRGGYEPRLGYQSRLDQSAAPILVESALQLLAAARSPD